MPSRPILAVLLFAGCTFEPMTIATGPADAAWSPDARPDAPPPPPDAAAEPDLPPPPFCDPDDQDLRLCLELEGEVADGSAARSATSSQNVTFVDGPPGFGMAGHFGATSRITTPDGAPWTVGTPNAVTFEAWIRPEEFPATGRLAILDKDGEYGAFINADGSTDCRSLDGGVSFTAAELGVWHRLTCVLDGDTLTGYVDGQVAASTTGMVAVNNGSAALFVGANGTVGDQHWLGDLDGVRVWMAVRPPE